jgi:hypothetical protein
MSKEFECPKPAAVTKVCYREKVLGDAIAHIRD